LAAAAATANYQCDFCESDQPAVELYFVAQKFSDVIETFFELSSQTMAVVHFARTPAGEDVETLLKRLIRPPEEAIEPLVDILDHIWFDRDTQEPTYGEDPWFVMRSPVFAMHSTWTMHSAWTTMEISLREEARYLNPKVTGFLESIFGEIGAEVTADGVSVLTHTDVDSSYKSFYRAREFQSEPELQKALRHPERFLGAPPAGIANSGRMNAPGQPAFYGATQESIALAEIRPAVGSLVAVAQFSVVRPLTLLNLGLLEQVNLPNTASLFDKRSKVAFERHAFLRELSRRMVRPVMPKSQDHNYLITQVIADYLAMHPTTPIDGIIYPSVQKGTERARSDGQNVVLFHKAATTIFADQEKETAEAELYDYDDDEYEYGNRTEPLLRPSIFYHQSTAHTASFRPFGSPRPTPALELQRNSIVIHRIVAVDIKTDPVPVEVTPRSHFGSANS
jgi:3',5'-cyclic AMP phosphodiesterase CpdA